MGHQRKIWWKCKNRKSCVYAFYTKKLGGTSFSFFRGVPNMIQFLAKIVCHLTWWKPITFGVSSLDVLLVCFSEVSIHVIFRLYLEFHFTYLYETKFLMSHHNYWTVFVRLTWQVHFKETMRSKLQQLLLYRDVLKWCIISSLFYISLTESGLPITFPSACVLLSSKGKQVKMNS